MNNSKIEIARKWFEELRDKLILSIEKIDSTNFIITEWDHKLKRQNRRQFPLKEKAAVMSQKRLDQQVFLKGMNLQATCPGILAG